MKYVLKKPPLIFIAAILDILGSIIFFPVKVFKKPCLLNPKNILIVRLDHIGDFVCTTPLFKNLKKRFPEAKITVLVNPVSKDMALRDPYINNVISFSPFYLERGGRSSGLKGLLRVIRDVKNMGFDLGIEPRGDLISILIMWLGRVKYRAGYGITGGGFLLNKEGDYDRSAHIIDRNLSLLKDIGVPIVDAVPEIYFSNEDEEEVGRLLREKWISPNQGKIDALGQATFSAITNRAVVIHPFAGAKAKEWPRDNFQKLINGIKKGGRAVLLIGSAKDEGLYGNVIDVRGKFSLPQLVCLIKRAGSFIGLDSGPANIAAALNVSSVIICSGTNLPQLWISNNANVKFVYKDTRCKPCGNNICPESGHECMNKITVEEVMNAVDGSINGGAR